MLPMNTGPLSRVSSANTMTAIMATAPTAPVSPMLARRRDSRTKRCQGLLLSAASMERISRSIWASGGDLRGVMIGQALEAVGQVLRLRHAGAADQDRDRRNAALQRGLHLDAHRIRLVVNAAWSGRRCAEPIGTDHGEQELVLGQRLRNVLAKIHPERDVVDIHEDGVLAVMLRQPIADAAVDRA